MTLTELLLAEHSKAQCLRIVDWVGTHPSRFTELLTIFLGTDKKLVQRSAWPLSYVVESQPEMLGKKAGLLIRNLRKPVLHDAVKRNTLRIFRDYPVPAKYKGELMNLCFDLIMAPAEKPAVKSFALAILRNMMKDYPEIRRELQTIIEEKWDLETPAFRSQAKKVMKKM